LPGKAASVYIIIEVFSIHAVISPGHLDFIFVKRKRKPG